MTLDSPKSILEFLEISPAKIMKKGERFLLLNTSAMGTFRKDLISMLGSERAKGFLIRHGWSCGHKDADLIRQHYPNAPLSFILEQGPIHHTLEGVGQAVITKIEADQEKGRFLREGYWLHSFEAEQHLSQIGMSEDPICWSMIGYASGYCSGAFGQQIIYKEVECVGRGDNLCRFIGKTVEEWGDECSHELAHYGESKIAEELEEAHRKINQQHQQLQLIMNFNEKLSRMLLGGQNRQTIVDEIGKLVNAPVVVEDAYLNPLYWYIPKDDQNIDDHTRNIFLGTHKDEVNNLSTLLGQVKREKRAFDLVFTEQESIPSRTIAPITTGEEVTGFLSIIHKDGSNEDLRRMIVERSALVIAFEAYKLQAVMDTEQRLKGDFLDELLSEQWDKELILKHAKNMGYNFDVPHQILIITIEPLSTLETKKEQEQLLMVRKKFSNTVQSLVNRHANNAMIVEKRENVIVLIEAFTDENDLKRLVKSIQNRYRETGENYSFHICVSKKSHSIEEVRTVFQEAKNSLMAMNRFGRGEEIIFVERITLFDRFFMSSVQEQLKGEAEKTLEKLLEYDDNYGGAQLIQTLFVFLSNECNLSQTCRDLNVSSSGLKYRIQRIKEIGEIDLNNPEVRFTLQLALRVLIANGRISQPRF